MRTKTLLTFALAALAIPLAACGSVDDFDPNDDGQSNTRQVDLSDPENMPPVIEGKRSAVSFQSTQTA